MLNVKNPLFILIIIKLRKNIRSDVLLRMKSKKGRIRFETFLFALLSAINIEIDEIAVIEIED